MKGKGQRCKDRQGHTPIPGLYEDIRVPTLMPVCGETLGVSKRALPPKSAVHSAEPKMGLGVLTAPGD